MSLFFIWISRLIRFFLYGLALSIPLGNAPVEICSNIAIVLFLVECLAKLFRWLQASPKYGSAHRLKNPFFITLLIYFLWNVISVFFSINVMQSATAIYTKLLEGILLFFCFMFHIRKKKHLVIFLSLLFFGALLSSVNGLIQWFYGKDIIKGSTPFIKHDGRRVSGTFKHPNGFGGYLTALLPIIFSLLFFRAQEAGGKVKGPWKRWAYFVSCRSCVYLRVLFCVCLIVLGLTFSRGAWLGFIVGIFFLSLKGKKVFATAVLVVLFFVMAFVPMLLVNRSNVFQAHIKRGQKSEVIRSEVINANLPQSKSGVSEARTKTFAHGQLNGALVISEKFWAKTFKVMTTGRQVFWRDAFVMAMEHPFVGSGLNTYTEFLNQHADTFKGFYAHNCYLQMAVEIGFIGMLLFVSVLTLFFYIFLQHRDKIIDPFLHAASWGMTAGVLAFCVHAFFDTTMYAVQLASMPWILMGSVFAVFRMAKTSEIPGC